MGTLHFASCVLYFLYMRTSNCVECGKEFSTYKKEQKWCSEKCGAQQRRLGEIITCSVCGKQKYRAANKIKSVKGRYCGMPCYRIGSRNKVEYTCKKCGTKFMDHPCEPRVYCSQSCQQRLGMPSMTVDGYLEKRVNGQNKRLHRIIMERHMGRDLTGYHIHHKNHNKLDNRIENLEVLTPSEHSRLHMAERQKDVKTKRLLPASNQVLSASRHP